MKCESLGIMGAWLALPEVHHDDRGSFRELFSPGQLVQAINRQLIIAQVNMSVSKHGVIRGIHSRERGSAEAKMITCLDGEIFDVAVDLRSESETFGQWCGVTLDAEHGSVVILEERIGHAFFVVSESAVVMYATSRTYSPVGEITINPMDPEIGIAWPGQTGHLLSDRDAAAPLLRDVRL